MSSHQRARWELGASGVRALAVFASVVAVLAAVMTWRARPSVEPLPAPLADAVPAVAPAMPSGTIVVAVSGFVRRPGLVRLPAGARVADAIEAAGGVVPGTDLSLLNLARKVTDGELIVVGLAAPSGPGGTGGSSDSTGLVNLNTATLEQLQTLPGVGPVLAQRIIDYRDQHGGFATVSELSKVSGIGEVRFAELKDRVTV